MSGRGLKAQSMNPSLKSNGIAPEPEFCFSNEEARVIRMIWESLDIVKVVKQQQQQQQPPQPKKDEASRASRTSIDRARQPHPTKVEAKPKPAQQFAFSNLHEFQHKLCANILSYEAGFRQSHLSMTTVDSEIDLEAFDAIKSTYQTESMIQLLTFTIYNLSNINEAWYTTITKFARINSRIWEIGQFQYVIIGECLIQTILEQLGRTKFSCNTEIIWLQFLNQLIRLLIYRSQEPQFDIPIIQNYHTTQSSKHDNDILHQLKHTKLTTFNDTHSTFMRSVRSKSISSFGDDGARSASSVLSLKLQDDESSSISTIEQSPRPVDTKRSLELSDSSNDDESYDYLNSFGDYTHSNSNKHKSMFRLKNKKSVSLPRTGTDQSSDNRLSKIASRASTIDKRKEDCVIS